MVLVNTKIYSTINGIYYTSVNAVFGFVAFYLLSKGVSNSIIGTLISVTSVINFFLQPILGNAIDRSRKIQHHHIICILAALTFVSGLSILFLANEKWCLLLFLAFAMIMTQLNMPIINTLSSIWTNRGHHVNFGIARGIGSVCYALASFVIGYLSDVKHFGSTFIPVSICATTGLLLVTMIILSPSLSKISKDTNNENLSQLECSVGLWGFMSKYWKFMLFILGSVFVYVGHNIITNFTINIVAPLGGGSNEVGIISGIAAACELPTMFLFSKINKKISVSTLIVSGGMFFTIKILFCLIAFSCRNMEMLFAVQTLQMLGFALFIPASVIFTNFVISNEDITIGQAFVTASNSAGGIIGSLLGGSLLDVISVKNMLLCTVVISAIGTFIIIASVFLMKSGNALSHGTSLLPSQ